MAASRSGTRTRNCSWSCTWAAGRSPVPGTGLRPAAHVHDHEQFRVRVPLREAAIEIRDLRVAGRGDVLPWPVDAEQFLVRREELAYPIVTGDFARGRDDEVGMVVRDLKLVRGVVQVVPVRHAVQGTARPVLLLVDL